MELERINLYFELKEEAKAYYNAYEATGDQTLLIVAEQLDRDALIVELTYM